MEWLLTSWPVERQYACGHLNTIKADPDEWVMTTERLLWMNTMLTGAVCQCGTETKHYRPDTDFPKNALPTHFSLVGTQTYLMQVHNGLCRCGSLVCAENTCWTTDFLVEFLFNRVFNTFYLSHPFKYGLPLIRILSTDSLDYVERTGSAY